MLKYQDKKPRNQSPRAKKSSKKIFKFHWWYIPVILVILIIIAVVAIYFVMVGRTQEDPGYVKSFSQISTQSLPTDSKGNILDPDDPAWDKISTKDSPIIVVKQKDPSVENILIIGTDSRGSDRGRSDTMIIATINKKSNTLKLTSVMRDIKAYFPDYKKDDKLNAAFQYGGAGETINIINYNFKLDIQKYIVMNFSGFENIINKAGGVTITIKNNEATQIPGLSSGGTHVLNGEQALAYARIRHIDSDFKRVERQRNVITALYSKFKTIGVAQKYSTANECLNYVKTNIPSTELLGKMLDFTNAMKGSIGQYTVPQTGMYTSGKPSDPTYYIYINFDKQVPALEKYIWG